MKEKQHKQIKQKAAGRLSEDRSIQRLPKTMARQAWLKTKGKMQSAARTDHEGDYSHAEDCLPEVRPGAWLACGAGEGGKRCFGLQSLRQ